jgi:SRSO17 transposase
LGWRGNIRARPVGSKTVRWGFFFLGYASRFGQALIDRRLYLPEAWAKDAARRVKAGVPEDIAFATKPQIARDLIASALDAGVPCAWVLADALYGSDSRLALQSSLALLGP